MAAWDNAPVVDEAQPAWASAPTVEQPAPSTQDTIQNALGLAQEVYLRSVAPGFAFVPDVLKQGLISPETATKAVSYLPPVKIAELALGKEKAAPGERMAGEILSGFTSPENLALMATPGIAAKLGTGIKFSELLRPSTLREIAFGKPTQPMMTPEEVGKTLGRTWRSTKEVIPSATEKGQVQEGVLGQRPGTDALRQTAEAGRSDRLRTDAQVQAKEVNPEAIKAPAVKDKFGKVIPLQPGEIHATVMTAGDTAGYITNSGEFLNFEQAAGRARAQPPTPIPTPLAPKPKPVPAIGAAVRTPDGKIFIAQTHALAADHAYEAGYTDAQIKASDVGFLDQNRNFVGGYMSAYGQFVPMQSGGAESLGQRVFGEPPTPIPTVPKPEQVVRFRGTQYSNFPEALVSKDPASGKWRLTEFSEAEGKQYPTGHQEFSSRDEAIQAASVGNYKPVGRVAGHEKIVGAALRAPDGTIYSSSDHYTAMAAVPENVPPESLAGGWVTESGRFLPEDGKEAKTVAGSDMLKDQTSTDMIGKPVPVPKAEGATTAPIQPKIISTAVNTPEGIKTGAFNQPHEEIVKGAPEEQRGFIVRDANGERFVGREEAARIANAAGQVKPENAGTTELHSQQLISGEDIMQKARRDWIDEQRKTNPSFAPDVESWKELLPPNELKEVKEWEDLKYKSVAMQGPEKGYKPYKLSQKQKARLNELTAKYAPRQQSEITDAGEGISAVPQPKEAAETPPAPPTEPPSPPPLPEPAVPSPEGEPRTTGIAQRIQASRAGELKGDVPTHEELLARRREAISRPGVDPMAVSARIKETRTLSPDDLDVLRGHHENLERQAYAAGDALNANPNDPALKAQYNAALKQAADFWRNDVKPAQTIWSELGHGMQGEVDIDTGTLTGMQLAFEREKGRPPTLGEQVRLQDFANKAQRIESKITEAKSKYDQALAGQLELFPVGEITSSSLQARFGPRIAANPTASKFDFTPDDLAHIRAYATQNYINKGVSSLADTIHGIAGDTGLKPKWVAEALTKPGQLKTLSDKVYANMSARRTLSSQAKDYITAIDEPRWKALARAIWRAPFSIAVYGHGAVGMITHSGANIYRPTAWGEYWPAFINQFKFVVSPAAHESAMQDLVRNPNFTIAKRGGLANDPNLTYTDYGRYAKFFGLQSGRRGFDILKVYRQTQFDGEWAKIPDSIKSDTKAAIERSRGISSVINHSTGALSRNETGFLARAAAAGDPVAFAARLEATRWARDIGDPIKTADTFLNWNNASAADKTAALIRTRRAAEFGAFYMLSLAANQGLLKATGQKENINFTDPSKSDFLKHKFGGHTVALDGGLLMPIRLLSRVIYDSLVRQRKELRGQTRTGAVLQDVGQYALGKAAPSVSITKELLTGETFGGKLLPWSRDTAKPGKPKMTWGEYALSHAPIPLSGASEEVYNSLRERGMSKPDAESFMRGLAALAVEITGARVGKSPKPLQPKGAPVQPFYEQYK